jgi:hypothetical protein
MTICFAEQCARGNAFGDQVEIAEEAATTASRDVGILRG